MFLHAVLLIKILFSNNSEGLFLEISYFFSVGSKKHSNKQKERGNRQKNEVSGESSETPQRRGMKKKNFLRFDDIEGDEASDECTQMSEQDETEDEEIVQVSKRPRNESINYSTLGENEAETIFSSPPANFSKDDHVMRKNSKESCRMVLTGMKLKL